MKKRVIVISLGGSLIVPEKTDKKFLISFKKTISKFYKTHKFIIVCGGGTIARKYIKALKAEGKSNKELSIAGIRATRMNAKFVMQIFGNKTANDLLPKNMKQVIDALPKNKVVICGALRYSPKSTSDGTASKIARKLNTEFINLTNIKGLYSANPLIYKKAKFIPEINWEKFDKMANKSKHTPGQHFVLDQEAAKIIKKHKITTYIIGPNLKNLEKLLNKKNFIGTIISG